MINAYGPTEVTVCATMSAPLTSEDVAGHGTAPIGMPIEGTWVYVLDEGLEPTPPGGAGRVVIMAVGLARGYLDRRCGTYGSRRSMWDPLQSARRQRTGDSDSHVLSRRH